MTEARIAAVIHGHPAPDEDGKVPTLALRRGLGEPPYAERDADLVEWGLAFGVALGLAVADDHDSPRGAVAERVASTAWEAFCLWNGGIAPPPGQEGDHAIPRAVVIAAPVDDQERKVCLGLGSYLTEQYGLTLAEAKPEHRELVALAHRLGAMGKGVTPAMAEHGFAMYPPLAAVADAALDDDEVTVNHAVAAVERPYVAALDGKGYDPRLLAAVREAFLARCEPHIDADLAAMARAVLDRADELLAAHYGGRS
jgi:hypothetical protein